MNHFNVSRRQLAAAAIGGWVATRSAASTAHHGFSDRYNLGAPVWIEGEVKRATFAPPHPVLTIEVRDSAVPTPPGQLPHGLSVAPVGRPADVGKRVEIEFPPVGTFYRMYDSIRVGDHVAIIALENCQPPNQLRSQWIRTATGKVIMREHRMSYMVDACEQS